MKKRVRRSGRRAQDWRRHVTKSTRRREGHRARERVKRKVKRKKEKIKKMGAHGREREINKKLIVLCYSAVSKMRAHCSSIVNFLAFTIFDGANF